MQEITILYMLALDLIVFDNFVQVTYWLNNKN